MTLEQAKEKLKVLNRLVSDKNKLDYQYRKGAVTMTEYRQAWNKVAAQINELSDAKVYNLYEENAQ